MQMSLPRRQGNRYFLLGGPVDQAKDRSHPVRIAMAKRALRLIRWSKTDHAELQRHSRSKTPVVKVAGDEANRTLNSPESSQLGLSDRSPTLNDPSDFSSFSADDWRLAPLMSSIQCSLQPPIPSKSSTMRRRTGMLRIFMNAFASANPSDVLMKSMTVLGEAIMCFESPPAGMSTSKKNVGATWRI